ncbi:MAG: hypothetical protein NTU74_00630, partial [Deltaproteobacteria bacterium]|nr:hypothetical protein [Deltaproteobacteria bacterium]
GQAQLITVADIKQLLQCLSVNQPVSIRRLLDLSIAAMWPLSTLSTFPLIVFLGSTPCRQLNTLGDDISAISVINEKMDVKCRFALGMTPGSPILTSPFPWQNGHFKLEKQHPRQMFCK